MVPGRVPVSSRARRSTAAALALTVLGISPALAQEAGTTTPTSAPPWVDVGTHMTYHLAQATLPSGVYELVEDPSGPLTDPPTGKRYRESYTGAVSGGADGSGATGSGQGAIQHLVVAFDGDDVLMTTSLFVDDPMTGTKVPGPAQVVRASAASPNGLWVAPATLAAYRTSGVPGKLVLDGSLALGGTTYQTVSVVDPTAGSYSLLGYDAATGALLQSAIRSQPQDGGGAILGTAELAGIRRVSMPGLGAAVPAWLTPTTTLRYAGTQRWTNTFDGSSQDFAARLDVSFPEVGSDWARFTTRTTVTMLTDVEGTGEGLAAGAGPYWYDPAALAAMTEGQVLDTDPVTGQTLTVARVVQGATGPVVVIGSRMAGVEGETAWDVGTGVMLAQAVSTQATGITTHVELQAMP